ncbi:MAG: zinc-binding protein [Nanoarchaeota archaeon]|nr:zinc-binding protein [Nanoarchaeota archaeon]
MEGEKFKAVCSECGEKCEIPFNPTEGRPVKCNDCFQKGRSQRDSGRSWRKDIDVTCAECGKATTVPFRPTPGGKPVLCRDCFGKVKED